MAAMARAATPVVLGGGISGLACAYYLLKLGGSSVSKVILVEGSSRLGGWIQSTQFPDGTVYEHGPKSVRLTGPAGLNTLGLVEELYLEDSVLGVSRSSAAASKRFILHKGKLCPLSSGPLGLIWPMPPFSRPLAWYILSEPFRRTPPASLIPEDESFYSFFDRRFGTEIAEYISDPICRGTVAGDARNISIKSYFPQFLALEKEHGSVVKGLYRRRREGAATMKAEPDKPSKLLARARLEKWTMWSLKDGLQTFPDALASTLSKSGLVEVVTSNPATRVTLEPQPTVELKDGRTIQADHIFSCLKAPDLGKLLPDNVAEIKSHLETIQNVHVASVILEYPGSLLPVQGFGFLSPSCEGASVLGIVFDSCCFPQQNGADQNKTRITCMMGGHWFPEILGDVNTVSEDKMLELAVEAAHNYLGIRGPPHSHLVCLHKNSIPQHTVGHHKRLGELRTMIQQHNIPLDLLGASFDGVSINDCILNARKAVEVYVSSRNQ